MLQIISGKFYDSEDRFHNDCKGILYSNSCIHGLNELEYVKLEPAGAYSNISSYVVSYDNQLQKTYSGFQFVKMGDNEIIKQLKNILSFSLNCIFDENKATVEKICRIKEYKNSETLVPSVFLKSTLDLKKSVDNDSLKESKNFFKQIIGLKREDYLNVINCLIAYNASIRLLDEDMNLAYSMLVYCLESLSQNYDTYKPIWDDYDQNKKCKLEKVFNKFSEMEREEIKKILINDEHFKMTQRFRVFIERYLDDDYYQKKDERHIIQKDDIERALNNAYNIRSKYAHMLKPIMRQLTIADFTKDNDTFSFKHDMFFTYSGLLRTARTVITNFTYSLTTVDKEKYDWFNNLPDAFELKPAPYFWIWKMDKQTGEGAEARLEGFIECLIKFRNNIPNMDDVITLYFENLAQMSENNRNAAFVLGYLYAGLIKITDEEKRTYINKVISSNLDIIDKCCIYNLILLVMPINIQKDIPWTTEEGENAVVEYNKKKHKHNCLRLLPEIETMIYLIIANSAKDNDKIEKQKQWLQKAHFNANNNIDIQAKIAETIENNDKFDISYIWDRINVHFCQGAREASDFPPLAP